MQGGLSLAIRVSSAQELQAGSSKHECTFNYVSFLEHLSVKNWWGISVYIPKLSLLLGGRQMFYTGFHCSEAELNSSFPPSNLTNTSPFTGCLPFPVSLLYFPTCVSGGHLPNKQYVLDFSSEHLLLEEYKLRHLGSLRILWDIDESWGHLKLYFDFQDT